MEIASAYHGVGEEYGAHAFAIVEEVADRQIGFVDVDWSLKDGKMTNRACSLDTLSKYYGVPWSKKEIGGNCGIPSMLIVDIYIYL